jgi:uncharacterized protein (TIGR02145 family)
MKRLIVPSAILAAGVAFLVGCGDENNTTEITQVVGVQVLEAGEALPKCTADNEGAMVYSVDSAEAYYCVNKKWTSMKGEKGEDGKKGADGKNGAAGADGKDGKDGKDGLKGDKGDPGVKGDSGVAGAAGLSAYEIAKAGGFKGTEEEWIKSLKGTSGAKGDSGVAGTNCEIVKDSAGIIEIKCGMQTTSVYKAVCGKKAYDPRERFCFDEDTYYYCDGKAYNPDKQFCAKFSDESEQIYKMTTIEGENYTKTWMAENLNYETETGSFCYNDNAKYCTKYGRLYTWATAVGKSEEECGDGVMCNLDTGYVRGVCPEGWHLPDTSEWNALFTAVGGKATAGKMLKSTEGWNDYEGTSGNGSDTYFFSALPAGYRNFEDDYYHDEGDYACFWSSTEISDFYAECMEMHNYDNADPYPTYKYYGYSVRCLRD